MKAKERYRLTLLEYLMNPNNSPLNRSRLAQEVLGISQKRLYDHFSGEEITEIQQEALEMRRSRFARHLMQLDDALFKRALSGDMAAARLAYERFEGKIKRRRR